MIIVLVECSLNSGDRQTVSVIRQKKATPLESSKLLEMENNIVSLNEHEVIESLKEEVGRLRVDVSVLSQPTYSTEHLLEATRC